MAFEAPLRAHGELIVSESLPPPGYETFLFVFHPFAQRALISPRKQTKIHILVINKRHRFTQCHIFTGCGDKMGIIAASRGCVYKCVFWGYGVGCYGACMLGKAPGKSLTDSNEQDMF